MTSSSRVPNEVAKWSQREQDEFLRIMVEQVKIGNNTTTTFNKTGWNNIKKQLEFFVARSFTMVQLRNKMNKMKLDYTAFKKLLETIDFGWNSVTKTCTVEDESVWDRHIEANPTWSKFRRNGLSHWPELVLLFGDHYAGGNRGATSAYDFTDDDDHLLDVTDDVETVPVTPTNRDLERGGYYDSQEVDLSSVDRPSVQRRLDRTPTGYRKKSRTSGIGRAIMTSADSLSKRSERFNIPTPTHTATTPSSMSPPPPTIPDYNINACIALLNTVDDIPKELFLKASMRILVEPNWRALFIAYPAEKKKWDCIGAIDSTHITAIIPKGKQIPYQGRKGITTQNVMCACSFDMKFTFVYACWESSANDCRVFARALEDTTLTFPHPPEGKYYLVDSGYPMSIKGYLTTFKGDRYHLLDYDGGRRRPTTTKELLNYRHSSLRNVIERSFGALKSRFPMLRLMPQFSLRYQTMIVIACCGIHNYIREEQDADALFEFYGNDEYHNPSLQSIVGDVVGHSTTHSHGSQRDRAENDDLRKRIANQMARLNGYPTL
ncbi:uncharacterized protein LOC122668677 [Telopea speciosissima]|uniref:uncharacterized protein LOC122668677 n=1 Tax=Telopea speciosissima TaxID=54955 RepID=UPI001CC5FE2E|nr:uncharacterized protein LOC122668677 [Telopea speciosissima]